MKEYVLLSIEEYVYITPQVIAILYQEYGEKIEELENKALEDTDKEVDISGPSINSFRLKETTETISQTKGTGNIGRHVY